MDEATTRTAEGQLELLPAERSKDGQAQSLIVVEQLPVISERLESVAAVIRERVGHAMAQECTEATLKATKELRAGLNREFRQLEEQRKLAKAAVMQPYDEFEAVYRRCVTNAYGEADKCLKDKIDTVTDGILQRKENEIRRYFSESVHALGIPWLTWERLGIKVNMSVTYKKLKEQVDGFTSKVLDDVAMIATQDAPDEIMTEYKRTLNAAQAVCTVRERREAIAREAAAREAAKQREARADEVIAAVDDALPPPEDIEPVDCVPDPVETRQDEAPQQDNPFVWLTIRRIGHLKSKMKELKNFLIEGGYVLE